MTSPAAPRVNRRAFTRALASLAAAAAAAATTTAVPSRARAGTLTPDERAALDRGEVVRRSVDADLDDGVYTGGVSYALVDAPAPFVLGLLADPSIYLDILALTLEATPTGKLGDDRLVRMKHGGSLGTAAYTLRLRPADATGTIRFWMDRSFDHEIEDLWGFLRVAPVTAERSLATYAVLCDLGALLRLMFGEKIREYALDTPGSLRNVAGDLYRASSLPAPASPPPSPPAPP